MEGIPMENLPSSPAGLVAQSPAPAPTVLELDDAPLVDVPPTPSRPGFKAQFVYYVRIFLQFICSYVGLTAILAGYLLFGAFVFQAIEAPVETRMRREMREQKKIFFLKMYDAATWMRRENWTEKSLYDLNALQKDFIHFYNYDLEEVDGVEVQKWSFVGAMLFSLTVISTIGYGHIAPVTIPGQVFCILYALGGIPLMLLVLTNVGRVLANVARLLYIMYTSRLCQRVRMRCRQRRSRKRARKMARRRAMARKDSSRSTRSNRSRSNKSGKSRTIKKTASQATIRVDSEPYREGRPMSVNMELIRSEPPLPPSYDESNEIEEKLSDTRENAGMFSEEADKPNMSEAPGPVHFNISPTESVQDVSPLCGQPSQSVPGKAPKADMDDDFDDLSDLDEPEPEPEPEVEPIKQLQKPPIEFEKRQSLNNKSQSLEKVHLLSLLQRVPKNEAFVDQQLMCSEADCPSSKGDGIGGGDDAPIVEKKLGRASSSITLGEHCDIKRVPQRQFSCVELHQMDERRSISFNIEGIAEEEEDVSPKEDDVFLPKESQSADDLNVEVIGSASDLNKNKKKNRGKDKTKKKTKTKPKKEGETAGKARSSKHRKNTEVRIVERRKGTPKKLRTKRPVMSPPTLRSLHSKQLKILDSTTAVRLATYNKDFGNSREDLTTLIPALKHEKVRLLCEYDRGVIRDRVHNPRNQRRRRTATTDSGSSRSRSSRVGRRKRKRGRESGSVTPLGSDRTFDSDTESTDTDDPGADPLQQAEIPIGPVLAFFFSYIAIGAIMFFFIQDNWNLFESFYFCFITLTTIGFGDYVPADKLHSLLACCVYTLVGMAVTSMCIALIMKKFVVTVKHIGRRVGIVGDDD